MGECGEREPAGQVNNTLSPPRGKVAARTILPRPMRVLSPLREKVASMSEPGEGSFERRPLAVCPSAG